MADIVFNIAAGRVAYLAPLPRCLSRPAAARAAA